MQRVAIQFLLENYFFIAVIFSFIIGFTAKFDYRINNEPVFHFFSFWINFTGSIIGWLALYSYIVFLKNSAPVNISFAHIILLLVALCGIVGFLPKLLIEMIGAIG